MLTEENFRKIKKKYNPFWGQPERNSILYFIILHHYFGKNWLEWGMDTIEETLERNYKIKLNKFDKSKIQSLKLCFKNSLPWTDFVSFEKVGVSFNNAIPNFNRFEKLEPDEILITIKILNLLDEKQLSHEVNAYMASSLFEGGYIIAPDELSSCQTLLDDLNHLQEKEINDILKRMDEVKGIEETNEEDVAIVQFKKIFELKVKAENFMKELEFLNE